MQYAPFSSDIELPFYTSLASLKIDHDKLDDSARKVVGLYEIRSADVPEASCRMQVHGNALTNDQIPPGYYRGEGIFRNVNTIEEYRSINKLLFLHQAGKTIWDAINDGTIYSSPSLLSSFVVLSFADLKKYRFHYWFTFPAIHSDPPWVPMPNSKDAYHANDSEIIPGSVQLTGLESSALVDAIQTWKSGVDRRQQGFFLARKAWHHPDKIDLNTAQVGNSGGQDASGSPMDNIDYSWNISSLSCYETGFFQGARPQDCYVCFADPSNYPNAPGWMLRNLLVLVKHRWGLEKVQVLCYRDTHSNRDQARSFVLNLEIDFSRVSNSDESQMPKVTGWERNPSGKLMGRVVDLTAYMDPKRLADQAVDLNLKLIKWRISPGLDLEKIKNTRCLLLGAGTLGSYVARNLMGWGVRKITFVDNGSVSFSNPVRQPLFNFNDCLGGGVKKAYRASEALKEVYPGVHSEGHAITVPMAGHPITDSDESQADFEMLKKLIEDHDAIFLLMDTRESRWLPTVMGKAMDKIVMNAALGFDTFVVMRHGLKSEDDGALELGCYFCNDVVAPADSVKDQTLDQQCTVTRPGGAAIASALLVELFVSILQHPKGAAAPASASQDDRHPLGLLPHQIRGFLYNFSNMSNEQPKKRQAKSNGTRTLTSSSVLDL
ncbi:hypothetical protein Egran_05617 [Elaphomyces granulatus]|uniref:Ubiquitin-like modifier-activating enzyme ATG7 n=1 Tax=Elaphomyces granulatus TaxID=519963 RepID=A0A232LR25_9EURO|nr:hypothetical protein Egran_05617 [Elaphomyces granulatus]